MPSQGDFDFFDLTGKTALVTGASSGLGWDFALRLARQGAHVVVAARRADRLQELVRAVESLPRGATSAHTPTPVPGHAKAISLDVSQRGDHIPKAVGEAWAAFGGIDILVNNAGTAESLKSASLDVSEEEWVRVLDVNVLGASLVLREVAKRMVEGGRRGSIVNISSILGTERGLAPIAMYCASKAALIQFSRAMAIELGPHGIRVNALAPGYFPSEMSAQVYAKFEEAAPRVVPLARPGATDPDLTGPLLFLASDASAYVTGNTIIVDGGHSLVLKPVE